MKNNKGIAPILTVLIIVGVLVLGGGIYYFLVRNPQKPVACTQEVKICPDGSAVGRTGPNCEFPPCPDQTADWKTYADSDYGFEFKYPQTWELNSDVSSSAIHLSVDFAKFASLVDNKETCINGVCSRKGPKEDQLIINQASVGDEIATSSGLPGKVVSIGGVKGFRFLGYNPQAKAYNTGVVVFNSQVDRIELSMSIAAPDETQAENDKLNKDFDQIISTFKFTK
jgi:preprotein translocase subunit YajC